MTGDKPQVIHKQHRAEFSRLNVGFLYQDSEFQLIFMDRLLLLAPVWVVLELPYQSFLPVTTFISSNLPPR
jgi:hypothetical protein